MPDKPKDTLPESVQAHIPQLEGVFEVDDVSDLTQQTGLQLQGGVSIENVADGLADVAKARLVQAMIDLVPHPRNYYDRLEMAERGLRQATSALTPGGNWTGWTNWPGSQLRSNEPFEGCQDNHEPVSAALSALQWLEQATLSAMTELEKSGLRRQGTKSLQSRNIFLSGVARLYQKSFGVPYTHQVDDWRHPYYKFVCNADKLLISKLSDQKHECLLYAEYSSVKNMGFDEMHAILRKDESVK